MHPERIVVRLRASARVDRYLTARLAHVSRSRVQRHIRRGDVLVDGRAVAPSHRLHGGEVLTLPAVVARGLERTSSPMELRIVYEDAALVVVDKPAGLLVHPVGGEFRHTLLNGLHHHLVARGEAAPELGIVHRLDRLTSGLLVVAKSLGARRHLAAQVEARRMRRLYLGLVEGEPAATAGCVELPIRRDPRRPTRMQALAPAAARAGGLAPRHVSSSGYSDPRRDFRARRARTHYRVLRRWPGGALLRLELDTGRTHQIRVHLQALGTPLLGDPLYGVPAPNEAAEPFARLALHAWRLEFRHPTQDTLLRFAVPLPVELCAHVLRRGERAQPSVRPSARR